MKKIFLMAISLSLVTVTLTAQVPQLFKYQGLARGTDGNPVANTTISLRISVHEGSPAGTVVYRETHQPLTNEFGSFSINIGGGTVVTGNFSLIAWGRNIHFQEVEMDVAGGSSFVSMGTSQYLSIPYALTADSAKTGIAPFWVRNNKIGEAGGDTASVAIIAMGNTPNSGGAPILFCKNFGMGSSIYAESGNGIFILGDSSGLETNGNALIGGEANINGELTVNDDAHISKIYVNTLTSASGNVQVSGNLSVTGFLSKAGGSFKIDHPLDPTNKYLYHSFVESPDMKNIYDGTVTSDEDGNASVELPPYFEALNRDFRYQLTTIGQFAKAIISEEVRNNKFSIKTDKPNVKISWQVTGIRKDAYAEKHRLIPEVEKGETEKGKYLYPDSFEKTPAKNK